MARPAPVRVRPQEPQLCRRRRVAATAAAAHSSPPPMQTIWLSTGQEYISANQTWAGQSKPILPMTKTGVYATRNSGR